MTRFLTIILLLLSTNTFGQLHQIGDSLMNGNKSSLVEISEYLDNETLIQDNLGHHWLESPMWVVAQRLVHENSMFLPSEFTMPDTLRKKAFLDFHESNMKDIYFSELAKAFVITDFKDRSVNFDLVSLTKKRRLELEEKKDLLMQYNWVTSNGIDTLIEQKNPLALLKISSLLLRGRGRWNSYQWNKLEYIELLQHLTHTIVAVPNEKGELSYQIDADFLPESRINLLIFFAKNYANYSWNEDKSIFENIELSVTSSSKERELFEALNGEGSMNATKAFIELTTSDPETVTRLAVEYEKAGVGHSFFLPTFPYRFLKQMVVLTNYCATNKIDFTGTEQLRKSLTTLRLFTSVQRRFEIENEILSQLTLENVTALEYWSLIYGGYTLTYSAGRILDKFYSQHWDELNANPKHLELYLKKGTLFDRLGIIGICNLYHLKFLNAPPEIIKSLSKLKPTDLDIQEQITKILTLNKRHIERTEKEEKAWSGNMDYEVLDLEQKLSELIDNVTDSSNTELQLVEILGHINYSQIPIALKALERYPFKYEWKKYRFLEHDFGLITGYLQNDTIRQEFLENHSKISEFEFYAYYLSQAGFDFKKIDGSLEMNNLDYDKIYEMLKYDVVVAFVGGGGGKRNNQVYSLIKLLELTFETQLGYPKKLCNSNGAACSSDDRAWEWMVYLKENKLLEKTHDEPVSFIHKIN